MATEEQERTLIGFLECMHVEYQIEPDNLLTDQQKRETLKRDVEYVSGKTQARDWQDIRRELKNLYP